MLTYCSRAYVKLLIEEPCPDSVGVTANYLRQKLWQKWICGHISSYNHMVKITFICFALQDVMCTIVW